ncbi:MAG TPA: hypothetical protein PKZ69_00425 [Candidatus Cloacimonadota bacterium]|nr:hypothetical protein [Candidatus Cloacimonadota bacterium]
MFQVETLLAYKIITIDNQIIREEGISIVSTISTLLDGNGRRMQRHKVLSHHCIGYRPSVSYVDIWDNALAMGDANNPGVNDAILQGDFFSFDETLLENNKLSPIVEFTDLSAFVDNYNLGTTFKIDYSYRFNVNAFGSDKAIRYATK